jgi:C4-dicarboxylate-specific signal transduction histidine kinase
LEDAFDLCSNRFYHHSVALRKPELAQSLYVECRIHQIVQVLVNLLNNAFDAIQHLPEKWVQVDVKDLGDRVEIGVMDSGTGIPLEVRKKMFDPFYSTKSVQYGTGLGLSISQSLLQKNNGGLEYDEKSPHTRFVLTLPKRKVSAKK